MVREVRRYGEEHECQVGELFLPEAVGPPVAVVVHGGFWKAAYDRHLGDALCADLVARGWAAWNVEYRRVGDGGGWPETCLDVAAAIDSLAGLELDLSRVVAIGHSAGGHLALWAAGRMPAGVRVTHAVSQAGVTDLAEAGRLNLGDGAVRRFTRGRADAYLDGSPVARVPLGVPQLLVHGEDDDTVPIELSRCYARAARAAGDEVDLVEYAGGHYEHLEPDSAAWRAVVAWLP